MISRRHRVEVGGAIRVLPRLLRFFAGVVMSVDEDIGYDAAVLQQQQYSSYETVRTSTRTQHFSKCRTAIVGLAAMGLPQSFEAAVMMVVLGS